VVTREARNGAFSLEERLLIERAATVVGLALERARDRQALLARNSALETVVSLLRELREDSQPFELAGRALESCLERLPRGVVIYYEPEGGVWRARVWRGDFGNSYLAAVKSGVRLQDTPVGRSVLESGRPKYIEETSFDPRRAGLDYEDGYRIVSTATLPVFVAGQVRGVIGLGLYEQHDWSAADRALLETTATGLGIAIERSEAMERLAVQTRELRERNAEQDAFIYTVSHDLRGPLIAIEGMAALVNEAVSRGDGAEAAFLAGRVSANVARMTQLLDDLLTLSRVGRAGESPVPVDLGSTFASVLTDLDARVRARGVRVAAEGAWPSVLYPPSEAYQVLLNLVGNAVKFAGRDGLPPQVLVRCHHEGERVTLTVEDNGPGIPAAFRERVFALFQKVNAKAEGTGVGLAIVKRVAERHGGDAWVEDSALGGAAFRVTMPVAQLD
jgi:signal transduction histidine kinase